MKKKLFNLLFTILLLLSSCGGSSNTNSSYKNSNTTVSDKLSIDETKHSTSTSVSTLKNESTKITFILNGGTFDYYTGDNSYIFNYNEMIGKNFLDTFSVSKRGYTFLGWFYNGIKLEMGSKWQYDVAEATLEAKWQIINYTITYYLDGGTLNPNSLTTFNVETHYTKLEVPTKLGYTFEGWYLDSNFKKAVFAISPDDLGDKVFYAKWTVTYYTFTFIYYDNVVYHEISYKLGDEFEIEINSWKCHRDGYTFEGWYLDKELTQKVDSIKIKPTDCENKTFYAKWNIIKYTITYEMNGGTNNTLNPIEYTIESPTIKLYSPTRVGYKFLEWYTKKTTKYDTKTTTVTEIPTGSMGDIVLHASWDPIVYIIRYNLNGGTNDSSNPSYYYVCTETIVLNDPTRDGYAFDGWYSDKKFTNRVTTITKGSIGDIILYAKWNLITYTITYELEEGVNNPSNPTSYSIESNDFALSNPTKSGCYFVGWYKDSTFTEKIEKIQKGTFGNITLYARWTNQYSLSVTSSDNSKGTVKIVSGTGFGLETITVQASEMEGCTFSGWYNDGFMLSYETTYSFTMPIGDYSLVAKFIDAEEKEEEDKKKSLGMIPSINANDKTITYGLYPQTYVSDETLLSTLNTLTTTESNGWYFYNNEYYAKLAAKPVSSSCTFADGTTIASGTTYWFKCEPINWKILDLNNGYFKLLSMVILDKYIYANYGPVSYFDSDIRSWLNDKFYNTAFSLDNSYIQTTDVNNTNIDDSSIYYYTYDKVYLLSYQDYRNEDYGFSQCDYENARLCKPTDYAIANGADYIINNRNGSYWTRSTYLGYYLTEYNKYGVLINSYGALICCNERLSRGVRPSITIKIN